MYPGSEIWNYAIQKGILPNKKEPIEYIVAGCPKLNLTEMSNEDFLNLCKTIGLLNQSRKMDIIDATVSNDNWKGDKLFADISGKCARCGTINRWPSINILAEGGGAETFVCSNCGQSHSNSFQQHYYANAVKSISELFNTHKKIVLWGGKEENWLRYLPIMSI